MKELALQADYRVIVSLALPESHRYNDEGCEREQCFIVIHRSLESSASVLWPMFRMIA